MQIPDDIKDAVEFIHKSNNKFCISTAGAGSLAISWLLSIPGASNSILDIRIPYHSYAMADFLGYLPDRFVTEKVAKDMADKGLIKAKNYLNLLNQMSSTKNVYSVGCTATIATNREKRGEHKFYLKLVGDIEEHSIEVILSKNARTRAEEEEIVSRAIIKAISFVCFGPRIGLDFFPEDKYRGTIYA
ncbi:MAG: hypothetical protein AABY22_11475 [Nanoarchaeota archaeon]